MNSRILDSSKRESLNLQNLFYKNRYHVDNLFERPDAHTSLHFLKTVFVKFQLAIRARQRTRRFITFIVWRVIAFLAHKRQGYLRQS